MKPPAKRPLPYVLHRDGNKAVLVQICGIEGGDPTFTSDVSAYTVSKPISSPWGTLRRGSVLLLDKHAARFMVREKSIVELSRETPPKVGTPTAAGGRSMPAKAKPTASARSGKRR